MTLGGGEDVYQRKKVLAEKLAKVGLVKTFLNFLFSVMFPFTLYPKFNT